MTPRTKLFGWFASVLAALLGAYSLAVYVGMERSLVDTLDDDLRESLGALRQGFVVAGGDLEFAGAVAGTPSWPLTEIVRVRDGTTIYCPKAFAPGVLSRAAGRPRDVGDWAAPHTATIATGDRVRLLGDRTTSGGELCDVWIAERLSSIRDEHQQFRTVIIVVFPCALAVALVAGYWLAGRAIGPIESALAATRRFTADASHQLRTPLTILRAECDIALRKERSPEEYRTTIRSILEEADRLALRTDQLLELSRVDALGGVRLDRSKVDLGSLARGLCEPLERVASERGIALLYEIEECRLAVDPPRLRDALRNVVDNALRHTPRGGRVEVRVRRHAAGGAVLAVVDTGTGIAPEHLPHVFERFYRADREATGAGLGLAITRALVEAHAGSISIASEPGRGTAVTIVLPPTQASRGSPVAPSPAEGL